MKRGFNLLEVIAIVFILAILLGIAFISLRSGPDKKLILENVVNQFKEDIRFVRQRAIINKTTWTLSLMPSPTYTTYTSYIFLDDKNNVVLRKLSNLNQVISTATLFSFDSDGNFMGDDSETSATLTLSIDVYTATIKINSLGYVEVIGL
ncbi:MAG: prepilin-type cleavage/methylation domain-containing protein [Dictyoglomus thermophilum]|uniref:Type II secretion system protein H n=1 Tax=Dictyoglomus thermophilum TaxID=14 RepID=A0A7C2CM97_DICTH|nr:prepilin-type cleavage/methylation domain-containing protein [Dictyoglomus thermophilum]TYT22499.1 prepilin-type cleavage/methylation domain-containing protein [Dictyoglomus thermophilum]